MDTKVVALKDSIDIAKVVLTSTQLQKAPDKEMANSIADFIETLAQRLETLRN